LPEIYRGYTIFSFVRNPWARLESAYRQKIELQQTATGNAAERLIKAEPRISPGMPFEEFSELICALSEQVTEKYFKSQAWSLSHKGSLIPDFVGRLESVSNDWKRLEEIVGTTLRLERRNKNEPTSYRDYYRNTRIRNLAGERYRDDVRLFNYESDT